MKSMMEQILKNNKLPWWVSGPPGTGKTRGFIKRRFKKYLDKGISWERIVVLSHTVNAAKEILKAIKEIPEMKNIPENALEEQICTIHSYFKAESKKREVYDLKHHKEFCKQNSDMSLVKNGKYKPLKWDKHPLYTFCSRLHGKRQTPQEHWTTDRAYYCDRGYHTLNSLLRLKYKLDQFKEVKKVKYFEDMIEDFIKHSKAPTDIDVLIVDEAQDCNIPQVEALLKAATNVDENNFFFVGDKDQSIYAYSGAFNEFFTHLEKYRSYSFKEDEEPLQQGYRCGVTINKICKNIIEPQRMKLGLPAKIWLPAKQGSEIIMGNHHYIPRLNENCKNLEMLLNKILNTKETFLFTYRGNPTDVHTSEFLRKHGIDYKIVSQPHPFITRKILRCFNTWQDFYGDEGTSLKQIKEYWPYLPSKTFKAHGKGNVKEAFKNVIDGTYNIKQLHGMGFVVDEALKFKNFDLAVKKNDDTMKIREQVLYIKKVLRNQDIEEEPRVQHDNIHKIKGLTYDNVIVNLSVYVPEVDKFEPQRLGYTAYSRGRVDCWTIGSDVFNKRDPQTSLGAIQHDRGRIFSIH